MKNKFPYFPATERGMGRRKKNYGVAVNDAPYITSPTVDGKVVTCPYFKTWRNILDHNSDRLLGADFHMGRWRALYSGKYLGHYNTQEQAHTAWKAARAKALAEAAMIEADPPALLRYAAELLQDA